MVDEYSFMFTVVCIIIEFYYLVTAILDARGSNRIKRMRNRPKCKNVKNINPAINFTTAFLSQASRPTAHLGRNRVIFFELFDMVRDGRANLTDEPFDCPPRKPIMSIWQFIHATILSRRSRATSISCTFSLLSPVLYSL